MTGDTPGRPLDQTEPATRADPADLADAVRALLESQTLNRCEQLKRLLSYLYEAAVAGDDSGFSELAIGTRVFHRKAFDPKVDNIVRSQMLRLRRKLDEYYAGEGATHPARIIFKNSYHPELISNQPLPIARQGSTSSRSFWRGVCCGFLAAILMTAVVYFAVARLGRKEGKPPAQLAAHPLWILFRSKPVVVAVSTPLFFRSDRGGFERDVRINFPADLSHAPQFLTRWPASPLWDLWAPFAEIPSAVELDRLLRHLEATPEYLSARQVSMGNLNRRNLIVLGHPRGAPLLFDLLAGQNFTVHLTASGVLGGFVNAKPDAGEAAFFGTPSAEIPLERHEEIGPDYALVSSLRTKTGDRALSVFGTRVQTTGFILRKLLDPLFLAQMEETVRALPSDHTSFQLVLRVDYNKSIPIGAVYVSHRARM